MDIRSGNITVGEIMRNPRGMALLRREFPKVINTPMFRLAQGMSLNAVVRHWGHHVGQNKVNALIAELKKI